MQEGEEMLENRMVEDDYIETNNDYDSYLEYKST